MKIKIYTRTGDKGQTSLFGGKRVSKSSLRVEAYGIVDELNSVLGMVIVHIRDKKGKTELVKIQNDLFEIGSHLANPTTPYTLHPTPYLSKRVEKFEQLIDEMTEQLPALRNFILPGGGRVGSLLHFTRTVSRRAERRIVALSKKERVHSEILVYFNRLSDLLFTMARFVNYQEGRKEVIWEKR